MPKNDRQGLFVVASCKPEDITDYGTETQVFTSLHDALDDAKAYVCDEDDNATVFELIPVKSVSASEPVPPPETVHIVRDL